MNNKLICYFSATGVTKEVALKLKRIIDCDIYEIMPKEKYTKEDLDWMNKESRSSLEMEDKNSRPEIEGLIDNIDNYESIIIGFPVWWDKAPRIINTFIEENDLSSKRIFIFVTSGSSSQIGSFKDLKNTYPKLNFVDARRFNIRDEDKYFKNWIRY
jgi:flavodoxin